MDLFQNDRTSEPGSATLEVIEVGGPRPKKIIKVDGSNSKALSLKSGRLGRWDVEVGRM